MVDACPCMSAQLYVRLLPFSGPCPSQRFAIVVTAHIDVLKRSAPESVCILCLRDGVLHQIEAATGISIAVRKRFITVVIKLEVVPEFLLQRRIADGDIKGVIVLKARLYLVKGWLVGAAAIRKAQLGLFGDIPGKISLPGAKLSYLRSSDESRKRSSW